MYRVKSIPVFTAGFSRQQMAARDLHRLRRRPLRLAGSLRRKRQSPRARLRLSSRRRRKRVHGQPLQLTGSALRRGRRVRGQRVCGLQFSSFFRVCRE